MKIFKNFINFVIDGVKYNKQDIKIVISCALLILVPYVFALFLNFFVFSIIWIVFSVTISIFFLDWWFLGYNGEQRKESKNTFNEYDIRYGAILKVKYLTDSSGEKEDMILLVESNSFDKTGRCKVIDIKNYDLIKSFDNIYDFRMSTTVTEFLGRIENLI